MVTNVPTYSDQLLRTVLSVLLPNLLSDTLRRYFRLDSVGSPSLKVAKQSHNNCAVMYTAKVHVFVSLFLNVVSSLFDFRI